LCFRPFYFILASMNVTCSPSCRLLSLSPVVLAAALFSSCLSLCSAADVAVKVIDKDAPKEVSDAIRQTLQSKAVQLIESDKAIYEFWWRREIPLKPKADAKSLSSIAETTLLGIVSVGKGQRDYKDNEIPEGTYTVRFGLQPQDGDHLGSAEYPYFTVLIPVKSDTEVNGIKTYKAMVKASGKDTSTGHPIVLSLRPASSGDAESPKLTEPAPEQKCVRIKIPAKAPDADQPTNIVFELVYKGKGKI
jgi:hypothetical protein